MTEEKTILPGTLEVRNISKAFPNVQGLDDVSLDIRPGETHQLTAGADLDRWLVAADRFLKASGLADRDRQRSHFFDIGGLHAEP